MHAIICIDNERARGHSDAYCCHQCDADLSPGTQGVQVPNDLTAVAAILILAESKLQPVRLGLFWRSKTGSPVLAHLTPY